MAKVLLVVANAQLVDMLTLVTPTIVMSALRVNSAGRELPLVNLVPPDTAVPPVVVLL